MGVIPRPPANHKSRCRGFSGGFMRMAFNRVTKVERAAYIRRLAKPLSIAPAPPKNVAFVLIPPIKREGALACLVMFETVSK